MAQQNITVLVDDLDGSKAVETVRFGFDGKTYELDLSRKNVRRLEASLGKFVKAARTVGEDSNVTPINRPKKTAKKTTLAPSADPKAVRAWAAEHGIEVSKTGRVKRAVVEQYLSASG